MGKNFLIFKIGKENFAIDLSFAREIVPYGKPTPLHSMPDFFEGLIHLRGFFLPLIDLKKILGLKEEISADSKIKTIIISIFKKIVGIKIEDVEDIMTLNDDQILPSPALVKTQKANFINGGFYVNEKVYLIVDLEKIFKEIVMPHKIGLKERMS